MRSDRQKRLQEQEQRKLAEIKAKKLEQAKQAEQSYLKVFELQQISNLDKQTIEHFTLFAGRLPTVQERLKYRSEPLPSFDSSANASIFFNKDLLAEYFKNQNQQESKKKLA
jgi:hypothetical protein